MRTPKTAEPFTQRQEIPGELRGELSTRVPEGAFGGIDKSVQRGVEENVDLTSKIQDQADQFQVQKAKNFITDQKNGYLTQAKNALGENSAQYSPFNKDGKFPEFASNTNKGALNFGQNPRQKGMIQAVLDKTYPEINGVQQAHQAREFTKQAGQQILAGIAKNQELAPTLYNNPDARDSALKDIDDGTNALLAHKGVSENSPEGVLQRESQHFSFYQRIAQAYMANKDPQGAKAYIDGLQKSGVVTGRKLELMLGPINKMAENYDALDNFNKTSWKHKDAEGYINTKGVVDEINNRTDLNDQQKKTYANVAEAQAGKDKKLMDGQKNSRWNNFTDAFGKALNSKNPNDASPQALMAIPEKIGGTDGEKLRMQDYMDRHFQARTGMTLNFGGKGSNDLSKHLALHDGILNGNMTDRTVIGKMYDKGDLNNKEMNVAYKLFDGVNKGGVRDEINIARKQIKAQALEILPTDDATKFMLSMDEATQGDTPEQLHEYAKKHLEPEAKNPSHFWDKITGNKDASYSNAPANEEKGLIDSLNFEVGKEPVNAIMSSLATKDNPKPKLSDVEGFLHQLGDVPLSEIGRGKPINNAMQSLINWNRLHPDQAKPFDPKLIKWLSENHPNGYF